MAAQLARNIRLRALPVAERGGDDDIVLRGEISEHGALRQPRLGGDLGDSRVIYTVFYKALQRLLGDEPDVLFTKLF